MAKTLSAFWDNLRKPAWWIASGLAVLAYLFHLVFGDWFLSVWRTEALPALNALAGMPLGIAGAFLLLFFVLLFVTIVVVSVFQAREPRSTTAPEIGEGERIALNDLRALYRGHVDPVFAKVRDLLLRLYTNGSDIPLVPMLEYPLREFDVKRRAVTKTLDDANLPPVSEALRSVGVAFDGYQTAMFWMHQAERTGIRLDEGKYAPDYERLRALHKKMCERMVETATRPYLGELRRLEEEVRAQVESGHVRAQDGIARARFARCTDEEREFLGYFHDGPPKRIPENVFRAGEKMVEDRFLDSKRRVGLLMGDTVTFALPYYTREVIRGDGEFPNEELLIALDSVDWEDAAPTESSRPPSD